MADQKLPSRSEDFSEWYNQLVLRAELADYAPVRGCMIVRPYGWSLWENITAQLDKPLQGDGARERRIPPADSAEFHQQGAVSRGGVFA